MDEPPPYDSSEVKNAKDESTALQPTNADAPPTYESSPPEYTNDPPPPYNLVAQVRHVKDNSSGNADFVKRMVAFACCGTIVTAVTVAVSIAVPIAALVIGSLYLDDCPRERFIPIYLIVTGCFGVVKGIVSSLQLVLSRKNNNDEDSDADKKKTNPVDGLISCFLFAWFIAGCVWVYRIYHDHQTTVPGAVDYCNVVVYQFAFWLLTITYIFMALALCCCCGICSIACCVATKPQQQPDDA